MDYRENAGYIITDSCHVGDSEFVLGVHLTAPQQFVTWKCTDRKDYYWGHYFSDLFSAQKDLVARAQEEVQCLEEQRQNAIAPEAPPYSPWGNVQECETLCPGVYSVSTPGHGGVMVRRELAEKVPYPMTPEGQSTFMLDIMKLIRDVPENRGKGFVYWEPAWLPVPRCGWANEAALAYTGEQGPGGNEWANQALFDYDGNALPALKTIRDFGCDFD